MAFICGKEQSRETERGRKINSRVNYSYGNVTEREPFALLCNIYNNNEKQLGSVF